MPSSSSPGKSRKTASACSRCCQRIQIGSSTNDDVDDDDGDGDGHDKFSPGQSWACS